MHRIAIACAALVLHLSCAALAAPLPAREPAPLAATRTSAAPAIALRSGGCCGAFDDPGSRQALNEVLSGLGWVGLVAALAGAVVCVVLVKRSSSRQDALPVPAR